jgi:hypothetical protein
MLVTRWPNHQLLTLEEAEVTWHGSVDPTAPASNKLTQSQPWQEGHLIPGRPQRLRRKPSKVFPKIVDSC